jgi:hypothetical protein
LFALPVDGNKFKNMEIRDYGKATVPRAKKKSKDGPTQTTKPHRRNKGMPSLTLTSALDGSCVVSFTPRSLYPAGKRPCNGLNYEAGRAPDPLWMSGRSPEPSAIRN